MYSCSQPSSPSPEFSTISSLMHGKYSIQSGPSQFHTTCSLLSILILLFAFTEPVEDDELRGRAQVGVNRANILPRHPVAVLRGDPLRPGLALGARPLEAVVAVAQSLRANG